MKQKPESESSLGFLSLAAKDRREAFSDAALEKQVSAIILEKDFWVCWLLDRIFTDPELEPHFVFKGGTSLSKVYQVIDRFSEDVDLGITPAHLGFEENVFEVRPSRTARDKMLADMQARCGEVLEKIITPRLEAAIVATLGTPSPEGTWLRYEFDKQVNSPIVYFQYPCLFPDGLSYIRRNVKLEVGSLTDQRPLGTHPIRPWVADYFPKSFATWRCRVTALEISRTFWEKATILHAEYHRPEGQKMPTRQSRHFSDFVCLLEHAQAELFLADRAMNERVAIWKDRVFARKWARYDWARHGSFRLTPPVHRLSALEKDYVEMRPMFLTEPLPFQSLLDRLQEAEARINAA